MNYFICLINRDGFEWCILQTEDEEYAYRVFEDLSAPPDWNTELRATEESVETYRTYEVLRYDHSQFDPDAKEDDLMDSDKEMAMKFTVDELIQEAECVE